MCSLYRGFIISRFFSIYLTMIGVKKIVHNSEDFVIFEVPLYPLSFFNDIINNFLMTVIDDSERGD